APSAEILEVQIADRKHRRRIRQFRTPASDFSCPAEIGRTQEDERARFHLIVLVFDVLAHHVAMPGKPGFEGLVVIDKRHRLSPVAFASAAHPTPGCRWKKSQPVLACGRDGMTRKSRPCFSQPARSSRSKVRRTFPESSRGLSTTASKLSGCL